MLASWFESFGSPDVITTGEIPAPQLVPNSVLVQVEAVAVDHVDTFVRNGRFKTALASPHIVGRDLVGTVVASNVAAFTPGQAVWSNAMGYDGRMGATAEYVVVPAPLLFPVPEGVDHHQLIAAVHSAATASIVLRDVMAAGPNDTLLIEGAAGHVGMKLVSLAHHMGLRVLTTSAPRDFSKLTQLGSDRCFDYHDPITTSVDEPVQHAIDTSGRIALNANLTVLTQGGEVTLITAPADRPFTFDGPAFYMALKHINGFVISHATTVQLQRAAEQLNHQFADGQLLDDTLLIKSFKDAAWAHDALESGTDHGHRIVLTP
ncbi:alcohol dehydrogenase catalytic domain-containing protein [Secundilactobacillus kimchicus]|uniref:alcohol dehydrogenase catalytic domain-containing protein n=1 Tax=Secundilactobacillus kimchicus TaxID=528209 RepID=UPI0024A9CBE0|nr:zinc-binding dehydrogenase [Secundilactobacillus kimchicus]